MSLFKDMKGEPEWKRVRFRRKKMHYQLFVCLFVYYLSSNDQQMAASSVRTAWEQEWASVWSEELSHFI